MILQLSLTTGRAALLLGEPLDTSAMHGARGRSQCVWVNEAQRAIQIRAVMVVNLRATDLEILQAGTHRVTATWKGLSVSAEFLVTELPASSDD